MTLNCEVRIVSNAFYADVWTVSWSPVSQWIAADLLRDKQPALECFFVVTIGDVDEFSAEAFENISFTDEGIFFKIFVDVLECFFYRVSDFSLGKPSMRVVGVFLAFKEGISDNEKEVNMITNGWVWTELVEEYVFGDNTAAELVDKTLKLKEEFYVLFVCV